MASTINNYSVGLTLDAKQYIDASKLSRSETRALISDINKAREPSEQYSIASERLSKALNDGAISQDVFNRLLDSAKQKYGQNSDAIQAAAEQTERINQLTRQGEQLTSSLLTAEERHAIKLRELKTLLDTQSIGQETYNRALEQENEKLRKLSPAFAEHEKRMLDGKAVTAQVMTAEEKRSDTLQKLSSLLKNGAITEETYRRAVERERQEADRSNPVIQRKNALIEEGKRITIETLTPMEKFAEKQRRLNELLKEGAIDQKVYNRALDAAKPPIEQKTSRLEKMSQMANVVTASILSVRSGIDIVAAAKGAFDEVTNRIDATTKSAQKLGLTFTEITSLNFAAGEAGVSLETLERGIKEMMKRGFAVDGNVQESFLTISDEIAGIADQSERMQRATEIFGKNGADMLVLLQGGRDAIGDSVAFAEKWSSLTESQVIGVEQYNDTWARVGTIVEGLTNKLVTELAPVMTLIGEYILDSADGFEDVDGTIRSVVDSVVYVYGYLVDINEVTNLWRETMWNIATMNFEDMQKDIEKAMDFGTADKYLQQLYDKRFELDQKSAERRKALDDQRKKQQIDNVEEVAVIEEQKVENFDNLYKQALGNASKEFERKAAEAKKIADSIAKGPADIEAGSAEAARFLAEQTNRQLADGMMSDAATASETAMLEEAAKQLEQLMAVNDKQTAQVDALKQLVEITSQNGFKRLR